jgi:hypothetical protein
MVRLPSGYRDGDRDLATRFSALKEGYENLQRNWAALTSEQQELLNRGVVLGDARLQAIQEQLVDLAHALTETQQEIFDLLADAK